MVPVFGVALDHRHLQHLAACVGRNGEERRVGRAPLGPERRQDDVHHLVVDLEHLAAASRRTGRPCSTRSPTGTRTRSRSGRGSGAGVALLCAAKLGYSLLNGSGTDGQRLVEVRRQHAPCSARCPAPCAGRPCRRRSRRGASCGGPRSAPRRRAAPCSCARPRRTCRCAAAPTARSRSRRSPSCRRRPSASPAA